MKNFTFSKYIGVMLLLAISTWFSWFILGCKESIPCKGFESEPILTFYSDSIPFRIEVTSPTGFFVEFATDSLEHSVKIPIDMNAEQLEMDVFMPDFKGTMVFRYTIDLRECGDDFHQLIFVENFALDTTSTFSEVYLNEGPNAIKLSQVANTGIPLFSFYSEHPYDGLGGFHGNLYLR